MNRRRFFYTAFSVAVGCPALLAAFSSLSRSNSPLLGHLVALLYLLLVVALAHGVNWLLRRVELAPLLDDGYLADKAIANGWAGQTIYVGGAADDELNGYWRVPWP